MKKKVPAKTETGSLKSRIAARRAAIDAASGFGPTPTPKVTKKKVTKKR